MAALTEDKLIARGRFARPVDPEAARRDWAKRGYGCEDFVDPPGREWNGFVHRANARVDPRAYLFKSAAGSTAANELVTVVEGRLRLIVGKRAVIAEAGDEVFIPRDAVHSVHNIHSRTPRWLFGYDG